MFNNILCDKLEIACWLIQGFISPEHDITDLEYTDNLVLFDDSYDEIQIMLNVWTSDL